MTYIEHISHVSWRFAYTKENEIGRQLMKSPQAAAIGPLLILSPSPQLTHEGMYNTEGVHSQGFVTSPLETGPPFPRGHPGHVKV